MTTEPHFTPLPPVTDRRAPERRMAPEPHEPRDMAATAVSAVLAIAGGSVIVFLFFALVGAVDLQHVAWGTIAVCVLALIWLGGFLYRRRHPEDTTLRRHDRERRGF